MKVKELIEKLQKLNPELIVVSKACNEYDIESLNGIFDDIDEILMQSCYRGSCPDGEFWSNDTEGNFMFSDNATIAQISMKVVVI